jgi:acylphosphatase
MAWIARQVRVTGRVQGVFFRGWTSDEARSLGVTGWVRNCSDGSVEAHLEGAAEDVEELIDIMREGPPGARVDDIETETADPEGHRNFEILH